MNRERVELFAEVLAEIILLLLWREWHQKKHPIMNIRAYQKYL